MEELKYFKNNERQNTSQAIFFDQLVKSQLPATIGIRTPTDESKEFVRQINRAILPQDNDAQVITKKLNKRIFHIKVEEKIFNIECLYCNIKSETLRLLLTNRWLVSTNANQAVLDILAIQPESVNIYFIRRRAQDGRWYLMLQVEERS